MSDRPTKEQWDELKKVGSQPKFSTEQGQIFCSLVDSVTGKHWHIGKGYSNQAALASALSTAKPATKPKTTAEVAKENMAAAKQIADLEKRVDELQPAATRKRRRSTKSTNTEAETDKPSD